MLQVTLRFSLVVLRVCSKRVLSPQNTSEILLIVADSEIPTLPLHPTGFLPAGRTEDKSESEAWRLGLVAADTPGQYNDIPIRAMKYVT